MRTFFYKLAFFLSIIVVLQIGISLFVAPRLPFALGLPVFATLDRALQTRAHVLYFGDSVITSAAANDVDRSSIAHLVQKSAPSGIIVADVSSPAYHLGIFEAMVTYLSRMKHSQMSIVIPINLRSFSPEWDMVPGHQFENEIFFLTHPMAAHFNKPLAIFQAVKKQSITREQFEQTPVFHGKTQVGMVKEFIDDKHDDASAFLFYYMYHLDRNHRKLESLAHLVQTAVRNKIEVYVYITPIDYQRGEKMLGTSFTEQVRTNTSTVCGLLAEYHVQCLDLSTALSSSRFDYSDKPNEHLTFAGREYVAQQIQSMVFER